MSEYDEFDYKITQSEWARRVDSIAVQITNNGYQWVSMDIPRRHVEEVAKAMLKAVASEND